MPTTSPGFYLGWVGNLDQTSAKHDLNIRTEGVDRRISCLISIKNNDIFFDRVVTCMKEVT